MDYTLEQRVRRGASILDEYFGSRDAWACRVDTQRLNIEDPYYCVLGQVFGTYLDGLRELANYWPESPDDMHDVEASHGFHTVWLLEDEFPEEEHALRTEWQKLLAV